MSDKTESTDSLCATYAELLREFVPGLQGLCILDHRLRVRGEFRATDGDAAAAWLRDRGWDGGAELEPAALTSLGPNEWQLAFPMRNADAKLDAAMCMWIASTQEPALATLTQRLKPALEVLRRQITAVRPSRKSMHALAERSEELEWLFKTTTDLASKSGQVHGIEQLMDAALQRLGSDLCVLLIPERKLVIERQTPGTSWAALARARLQTQTHLLNWVQQRRRPLVVNHTRPEKHKVSPCKILAVPVVRGGEQVLGALLFFSTVDKPNFNSRHTFLGRHLGQQVTSMLDAQYDAMTGHYTRSALQQIYSSLEPPTDLKRYTALYIDIDSLHVVNEVHGFEIGDELIVRISGLLTPPLLPQNALVARASGDRFCVVLADCSPATAMQIATRIQEAAAKVAFGPPARNIEVSVSCGVAEIVDMPQGLARALAAAEVACKKAKELGTTRVQVFASDDSTIKRRHDDIFAVGYLREALKTDRLLLYAQRIVPLQDSSLPDSYELLTRLCHPDGRIRLPSEFLSAAQRYQLMPSIDRWVLERTLQMLASYSGILMRHAISVSINISGQSVNDPAFIGYMIARLRSSRVPPQTFTIEITEQTAVTHVERAAAMMRELRAVGCRLALDDFGIGSNSFAMLRGFPVTCLKIDGSFVHDILTSTNSEATCRAVVQLATELKLDTVAEYVETRAIADKLRTLGVDYAQGYAFGKPRPLSEVLTELQEVDDGEAHRLAFEI